MYPKFLAFLMLTAENCCARYAKTSIDVNVLHEKHLTQSKQGTKSSEKIEGYNSEESSPNGQKGT